MSSRFFIKASIFCLFSKYLVMKTILLSIIKNESKILGLSNKNTFLGILLFNVIFEYELYLIILLFGISLSSSLI